MGRDIHFYVEQRDAAGWRRVEDLDVDADGMFRCLRCQGTCIADGGEWIHDANSEQLCPPDETEQGVPARLSWYDDRNYTLFGALAFGWVSRRHLRFYDDCYTCDCDDPDTSSSTWTEPLWRNVPNSFFGAVLRMSRLAAGNLDAVRCVFWFDN